jgi:Cu+-exporting ATPase
MFRGPILSLALAGVFGSACEREAAAPVTTVYDVEGMTCESCVEGITGTITLVEGVSSVKVDLLDETAVVVHDPGLASVADLEGRIDRMGYEATPRPATAGQSK